MLGCSQNHFNIPAENFAEKVSVLGVAPIFIDVESEITYPQKELLIPLISDFNRKYEPFLIRKLQSTDNYYAVTLQPDEPKNLFSSLLSRREKRDDAGVQYNKYFWKNDEIVSYIKKNRIDALMVVVVSGLTRTAKLYSSNLMNSLETNYNFLTMTAQIVGVDGALLWEYPNFRGRILPYYPITNLQYADFSESEANLSNKTEVKFKSIDGIRRTLEQKKSDIIFRETDEPEIYGRLFDEMVSLIKNSADKSAKSAKPVVTNVDKKDTSLPPTKTATSPANTPIPQPSNQVSDVKSNIVIPVTPNEVVPAN